MTGLPFDEFTDDTTYGFTDGDPILKDKLFFFANDEELKQADIGPAGQSQGTNPLASSGDFTAADVAEVRRIAREVWGVFDAGGLSGDDTELEEYALKLDWNITDDHRASMRQAGDAERAGLLSRQLRAGKCIPRRVG